MALTLKMTEDTEHIEKQQECLDYLRKNKVDVGLTSHASGRSFFLLGIHTRGSPIMHIPPRPVVDPALHQEGLQQEMGEFLLESCEAAFDGDMSARWQAWKTAASGVPTVSGNTSTRGSPRRTRR